MRQMPHLFGKNSDRGASAVLVAMAMVMLMGFAAIAVDSGLGFDERRQQQSGADVGSLAASQFARTNPPATHPDCLTLINGIDIAACRGAEEALDVVDGTLPGRYTDADWDTCVDTNKPAEYSQPSFISDCISYTENMQRVRVVLPGTDVDTAFGGVLGFDSLAVGAFAEAQLDLDIIGGVWPFALGPGGSGSDQACFFAQDTANTAFDIHPCNQADQGNFGKLSLYLYGNEAYGTPLICSGANAVRMETNIVTGSDHPLEPESRTPGTVNDDLNCAVITNPVDQVEVQTGNAQGALAGGLFDGITQPNLEGRLLCKGALSTDTSREDYPLAEYRSLECATVGNQNPEQLDHTALWHYINPGANPEAFGKCPSGVGYINNRADMEACIAAWKSWPGPHTVPLFTTAIATSPRFGAVPELDSNPGNGFAAYNITSFVPVYLETIYSGCNANDCAIIHSPGEDGSAACPTPIDPAVSACGYNTPGLKLVEAITSFVLTLDMLPAEIADKFPFTEKNIRYNLHR